MKKIQKKKLFQVEYDKKKWMEIEFPIFEFDYFTLSDLEEEKKIKKRKRKRKLDPFTQQFLLQVTKDSPLGDTLLLSLPNIEEEVAQKAN